jgi:uncharacterized protein
MQRALIATALTVLIAGGSIANAQDANTPPPSLNEQAIPNVLEKAVDGFIRPGYHKLHESAAKLVGAMDALCASPDSGTYQSALSAYAGTVDAWSRIEIVRVGPALDNHRFERILFFPDRKSIGLKQVQEAIATKDKTATDAKTLADKSVAMQGLGALEFVLYGTGSDELLKAPGSYRCHFGDAIAKNIETIAGELTAAWDDPQGVAVSWKQPGPNNPVFRDGNEAITALLGILVHAGETVRDERIEYFYGGANKQDFPHRAIYWRSQLTWPSVEANVEAIDDLFKSSGMVELLDPSMRSIAGSIDFVTNSVIKAAKAMDPDIDRLLGDEKKRSKIEFVVINMKDLVFRLNNDFGGAIGLGAGFSFSDGD